MDLNNMTENPSQEIRKPIFNFEAYPTHNVTPIDWSRIPMGSPAPPSSYIPSGQFNPSLSYQQQQQIELGNFLFNAREAPVPAQFPFPISPTSPPSYSQPFGTRCKRKTDSPPLQPVKQHITEEKMAEHMSKLHISSETEITKESETARTRRLYMCEEMRRLQNDSILPQSLLSTIQQPCKALVLWKPPGRLLLNLPKKNGGGGDDNDDENGNNNTTPSTSSADNNEMDVKIVESESEAVAVVNDMDFDL